MFFCFINCKIVYEHLDVCQILGSEYNICDIMYCITNLPLHLDSASY